jgi:integrase
MAERLTDKLIRGLRGPDSGHQISWDSEISGFGVRITAAGVRSFILDYRVASRQRRITIGRYPEMSLTAARVRASDLRVRVRDGHDPMEERQQGRVEPTVADLADDYLKRYAIPNKRPSSIRNDTQMIDRFVRPKLGRLRLKAIGKRDVEALHNSLKVTPYMANRVLSLLSKMFSLAIEWKWMAENPVRGVAKCAEEKRERWLSLEEMQKLQTALDSFKDQNAANALRLLLLTGSRMGEVIKAEWDQFDLSTGVWTKPSHNTKQKRVEHVPLSEPALQLLKSMKGDMQTGPLFPGRFTGARTDLKRPWMQACRAAGLVTTTVVKGKRKSITLYRPIVRIHDLRHSYASHLVSNGVSLEIVGKLLGHTQAATTMRYAHIQDAALRSAANRFGDIYSSNKKQNSQSEE